MPEDARGNSIQVLAPDDENVAQASIAAGNNRVALPPNAFVVEVGVQDTCRFAFGTSGLDVTSGTRRLLTGGVFVYRVPHTSQGVLATHFAVTQVAGSSGVVTVTKLV